MIATARAIEETGLDSLWVADHIVLPLRTESAYPYGSGGSPFKPEEGFLEALTTLAVVAGATERVTLGTSVLVMPMRHPVLLAKQVATLDVLSGGRSILGVGVGWWAEEFRALGANFESRGRRFDEQLRIVRRLWTRGSSAWSGEFFAFPEIACEPRPLQAGGPPLWIGGTGPRAWRRAARFGDGWHGIGFDLDNIAAGRVAIAELARLAGRDPQQISISRSIGLPSDPEGALERLRDLARSGVTHVVLTVRAQSESDFIRAIESSISELVPRAREALAAP